MQRRNESEAKPQLVGSGEWTPERLAEKNRRYPSDPLWLYEPWMFDAQRREAPANDDKR